MVIWMKVTKDKYELPLIITDTAGQLAEKLGVTKNHIYSAISHAEKKGYNCIYKKVVIKD